MPRKKGYLTDRQKRETEENRRKVEEAIQRIRGRNERETTRKIIEEIKLIGEKPDSKKGKPSLIIKGKNLTKPTVIKYWKEIKDGEKPVLVHGFLTRSYDDFISKIDPKAKEVAERLHKKGFLGSVRDFMKFVLFSKDPYSEKRQRIDQIKPLYEKKLHQIERSLTIETRANKMDSILADEISNSLMGPLVETFFLNYYGLQLDTHPEDLKCQITIKFDPLKGTIKALQERIALNEQKLTLGRFIRTYSLPTRAKALEDFDSLMRSLVADHVELYRLESITTGALNHDDLKRFSENVIDLIRKRISNQCDQKLSTKFIVMLLNEYPFDFSFRVKFIKGDLDIAWPT